MRVMMVAAAAFAATTMAYAHEGHAQMTAPLPMIEAPSGAYKVDLSHASIVFRVAHFGISRYTVRFAKFDSRVQYDAADPTRSTLSVTIDPRSIRTDYPFLEREDFDKELAGPKWLDAAKYPEIRFVARSITATAMNKGRITGDLTMKGVTRPVVLDATWNGAVMNPMRRTPVFGVSATGRFNRSDFGVKGAIPVVADEIQIEIEAEYVPA